MAVRGDFWEQWMVVLCRRGGGLERNAGGFVC
jgi:hypothetical protein